MMTRVRGVLLALVMVLGVGCESMAAGKPRHVVVMVWDGMRPDFVTQEYCPNLYELARGGVRFANHHPAYLSATEVNGTAIATGCYPSHSGIIANKEYRPAIDATNILHMEDLKAVRKGDEVSGGHYLGAATTAEIMQRAGYRTAIVGAKPIALLHDRAARDAGDDDCNVYAGATLPEGLRETLVQRQGPFPAEGAQAPSRNDWATRALVEGLWKDSVPAYSLLWLNEPDWSQHKYGPGAPESLAAIRNADENLGRVIQALKDKGVWEQTDVIVASDHGFSTIGKRVKLEQLLQQSGFRAVTKFEAKPAKEEILVDSNGGAYLLYVAGHDREVIRKLVDYLQTQDFTGVIFTKEAMPGTFALSQAKLDSATAPDVVVSMRWSAEKNAFGVPGMQSSGVYDYGEVGMHVSLSCFDMHNTMVAAGPDFRKAVVSQLPSGNVDIAPTVLWVLGIRPPKPMDGRVLTEALAMDGPKLKQYEPRRVEASRKLGGSGIWRQYLNFSEVNGVVYLDEGNGRLEAAAGKN